MLRILLPLTILAFFFTVGAQAREPWAEKLVAEGWTPVNDPTVYQDTTWSLDPWVVYVPADGVTIIWRNTVSGAQLTATRVSAEGGKVCRQGPLTGGKVRCQVYWSRGDQVREVTEDGQALAVWTVRKGNPEGLKP